MKTILVTGGAGYIGSHTCKALARAGFLPICYDNLSTGHREAVQWGPLVVGDIADKRTLKSTILKHQPIAAFHFAANALVLESEINPAKYYRSNVAGTLSLLETMLDCDLKRLIFSSSCAVYGEPHSPGLIAEGLPLNPINSYGWTKRMAEQMMEDFDRAYGLKTIVLRYFNAAGADVEGDIGENHQNETHLIPKLIQTALGLRNEMTIYGDGSAVRDYTHVADLAIAHVQALEYLMAGRQSDQFNLGSGVGTSILEILAAVQAKAETQIPVRFEKRKNGDPHSLVADNKKAKQKLGWEPKLSNLDTVLDSAYYWHAKNEAVKQ